MVGEVEYLVALVAYHFGLRERFYARDAASACEVDVLLLVLHSGNVLFQGDIAAKAALEHQQILQIFLVCAEAFVNAVFQLSAEGVEELFILLAVVLLQLFQFVLDGLFKALCDELELTVMLEHFTRDVQGKVLAVHQTSYKAEVIRQQVGALVHYHYAAGVQLQTLFEVLGVVVVGRLCGNIQQRGVGSSTLGAGVDMRERLVVVVELVLVELVVFLVGELGFGFLPDRGHAVEGLGDYLLFVLVLAALFQLFVLNVHLDGVADIVAVLLYKLLYLVRREELVVILLVGVVLDVKDYLRAVVVLLRF